MAEDEHSTEEAEMKLPIAFLAGVKVEGGERYSCSAVCHFATEKGERDVTSAQLGRAV